MFASETILLNPSIACLEFSSNAAKWRVRDVIITDRAAYFFAANKSQNGQNGDSKRSKSSTKKKDKQRSSQLQREETVANYLITPYERLDVKNFRAQKPIHHDEAPPDYLVDLPPTVGGYQRILEL
jgi:hypothetical protein